MKTKVFKEFFLYLIVGGAATLSEWIFFFLLNKAAVHYLVATFIAYMLSTLVNWFVGRVLVFKESKKNIAREILDIYIAGIIGLLLNLLIMFVTIDILSFGEMFSKIIATGLVFAYNFLIRKFVIYK